MPSNAEKYQMLNRNEYPGKNSLSPSLAADEPRNASAMGSAPAHGKVFR